MARRVVQDAATRTLLVERIVVERGADRVVVGVGDVAACRIDRVWHFLRREDFVRQVLAGVAVLRRQPLIAAGAVADDERRRAIDAAGLQVLSDRCFGTDEVGEVALLVDVREVLRAHIEIHHAGAELFEIARAIHFAERLQLVGRAPAGVLDRQAGIAGDRHHRTVVAAWHDDADAAVGVADGVVAHHVVRHAIELVDEVALEHPQHRLAHAVVDGVRRQPVGVQHELFLVGVGHVQRVGGQAPAEIRGAAQDRPRRARRDRADRVHRLRIARVIGNDMAFLEQHRRGQLQMRIVGQDRAARGSVFATDHPPVAAGTVFAPLQVRGDDRVVGHCIAVTFGQLQHRGIQHRRRKLTGQLCVCGVRSGTATGHEIGDRGPRIRRRRAVGITEEQGIAIEARSGTGLLIGPQADGVVDFQIERELIGQQFADHDRIHRRPRIGRSQLQRAVFDRQRMGRKPGIDAVGIGLELGTQLRRSLGPGFPCGTAQAQGADLDILRQTGGADHFSHGAAGATAQRIHLEEAGAGVGITHQPGGVLVGGADHRRHAFRVPGDRARIGQPRPLQGHALALRLGDAQAEDRSDSQRDQRARTRCGKILVHEFPPGWDHDYAYPTVGKKSPAPFTA